MTRKKGGGRESGASGDTEAVRAAETGRAAANPALNELGGLGRLDTLLRRILPEFPAFLGIMDAYHAPAEDRRTNTPLDNPPVTSSWGTVRKVLVPTLDVHVGKDPTTWERGLVKGERGQEAIR